MAQARNRSRRISWIFSPPQAILKEYGNPDLTLNQAARHCGVSKNHLNVLLIKQTGLTFHQLLTRYRLLQAAQMMPQEDYSLLDIALENGFDSPVNFYRHLQKIFGISPGRLRKHLSAWEERAAQTLGKKSQS